MAPAMMGDEKLVPDDVAIWPFEFMTAAPKPRAETSGLMRPSKDGPWLLNPARMPNWSTAPTAKIESASAGAEMYFQLELPSLPAEIQSIIPVRAAATAASEMGVLRPSMSA